MNNMLNKLKKIRIKKRLIVLFLAIYLIYTLYQVPDIMAENDFPLILGAHRGNSVDYFENSIPAIKNALEDPKYNFIEIDIQYTKDKKLVVFHDLNLVRLQQKNVAISDLTFDELQLVSDFYIPLYDEVVEMVGDKKPMNVEIKSQGNFQDDKEIIDFVIEDAKNKGFLNNILLSSISTDVVKYVDQTYPNLEVGKIYWILPSTYITVDYMTKKMYKDLAEMGADYAMLHGVNLRNYQSLTKLKPDNITLVFWYFNDKMYVVHNTEQDTMWYKNPFSLN